MKDRSNNNNNSSSSSSGSNNGNDVVVVVEESNRKREMRLLKNRYNDCLKIYLFFFINLNKIFF